MLSACPPREYITLGLVGLLKVDGGVSKPVELVYCVQPLEHQVPQGRALQVAEEQTNVCYPCCL